MKVLVTGAGGQLGKALLDSAPEGWKVEGVTRADCDLADEAGLRELIVARAPDLLINAAAYTAVDKAESEVDLAFAINRDAVGVMTYALAETGGRLVHVSTDFVFDGQSSRPYLPEDHRHALSVYGRSKAAGEDALRERDLLVRTAWVYAAEGANFVRTMLRLMRKRDEVRVVADQIGAPTWAPSLADTIWGLAAHNAAGTFHHCDAGVASWYDFAVAIQEEALALGILECTVPVIPIATADYPTPAARPVFSLLDCSKTWKKLENIPAHWRVNLRKMLIEEKALA